MSLDKITSILGGEQAENLLNYKAKVSREKLHLPGPDFVDRIFALSDRPTPVLRSLQSIFSHGRLANTGYVSILPVDQGIEHSAEPLLHQIQYTLIQKILLNLL